MSVQEHDFTRLNDLPIWEKSSKCFIRLDLHMKTIPWMYNHSLYTAEIKQAFEHNEFICQWLLESEGTFMPDSPHNRTQEY